MFPILAMSQSNNLGFNVGVSFSPTTNTHNTKEVQDVAFLPNVNFLFGSDVFKVCTSFGLVSRLLIITEGRYSYGSSGYFFNTINNEHGGEIGAGGKFCFGKNKAISIYCGGSIGLVANKNGTPKINICPINIGVFVNLLKV